MNGEWSGKPDYEFAKLVEEGLRYEEKLLQDKFLKPIKITKDVKTNEYHR